MSLSKKSSGKQAWRMGEESDLQNQPEPPRSGLRSPVAELEMDQTKPLKSKVNSNTNFNECPASQYQKIRSNLGEIEPKPEKKFALPVTPLDLEADQMKPDFSLGNSGSVCKSPLHEINSLLGHKREGHLTFAPERTNSGGSNNASLGECSPILVHRHPDERGLSKKNILTSSLTPVLGSTGTLGGSRGDSSYKHSGFMKMGSQDLEVRKEPESGFVEHLIRAKAAHNILKLQQTDEDHEEEQSVLIYDNTSQEMEQPTESLDYMLVIPDEEVKSRHQTDEEGQEENADYNTPTLDPQRQTSRNSQESNNRKYEESGPLPPRSFDNNAMLSIRQMPGYFQNLMAKEETKTPVYNVRVPNTSSILELSTGSPGVSGIQQPRVLSGDDLLPKILDKDSSASVPVLPVRMDSVHFGGSNNTLPDPNDIKRSGKKNQAIVEFMDAPAEASDPKDYIPSAHFKPLQVLNQKGQLSLSPSFGPDEFSKLLKTREQTQGSHFNDSKRSIHKQARRSTLSGTKPSESGMARQQAAGRRPIQPNPFLHQTGSEQDDGESCYSEVTEMRTAIGDSPIMRGIESVPRDTTGSRFRIPLLKSSADNSDTAEFRSKSPLYNDGREDPNPPDNFNEKKQNASDFAGHPSQTKSDGSKILLPLALGCVALVLILIEVISATPSGT